MGSGQEKTQINDIAWKCTLSLLCCGYPMVDSEAIVVLKAYENISNRML
jgi:hypothetical protein